MKIHLQYGRDGLTADLPTEKVTIIRPRFVEGLPDEQAAFQDAARRPIHARPLAEAVGAHETVAIVIADGTRPLPSARLLPMILAELAHVPPQNFTIIVGTGTHRANTEAELEGIVGAEVWRRLQVRNHNAYDEQTMTVVRPAQDGRGPLMMNREYVEADRRILVGFIEPHFMAGFSGGYKAAFPGVADLDSIMYYHRAEIIGHPRSNWGVLEENPTQEQIRANGSALAVDFLVNVTLNHKRQITRFFCGDVIAAHEEGCRYVKETAMAAVSQRFPLVITTNSGFPLDQNLYQSVKGMSAAAEIIADNGEMIVAARCNDGFPAHGNFTKLLYEHDSPQAILDTIFGSSVAEHRPGDSSAAEDGPGRPGLHMLDQWQAQKFAEVALRAQVAIYSELEPDAVARAGLTPVADLNEHIRATVQRLGADIPVAVLPEGPMTIPYVA